MVERGVKIVKQYTNLFLKYWDCKSCVEFFLKQYLFAVTLKNCVNFSNIITFKWKLYEISLKVEIKCLKF